MSKLEFDVVNVHVCLYISIDGDVTAGGGGGGMISSYELRI